MVIGALIEPLSREEDQQILCVEELESGKLEREYEVQRVVRAADDAILDGPTSMAIRCRFRGYRMMSMCSYGDVRLGPWQWTKGQADLLGHFPP